MVNLAIVFDKLEFSSMVSNQIIFLDVFVHYTRKEKCDFRYNWCLFRAIIWWANGIVERNLSNWIIKGRSFNQIHFKSFLIVYDSRSSCIQHIDWSQCSWVPWIYLLQISRFCESLKKFEKLYLLWTLCLLENGSSISLKKKLVSMDRKRIMKHHYW